MASVLDLVKHYQRSIEKYPNDEQKILKCIDKLYNLGVTVQHLQDTGVGRTVNALRKEPGEVGQAARALVLKWKVMVAAEESDQEGDHNDDTTNYSSHDNGRDYESNSSKSRSKHEASERSDRTPKTEEKYHRHTNGNYSGSKRRYQSSEEEDHDTKKSKYSKDNGYTLKSGSKIEPDKTRSDSEDSQDESSQSDSNSEDSQSEEERVPEVKPKIEKKHHIDHHKSSSHTKNSSSSRDKHKQESSHQKQYIEKQEHNNSSADKRHSSDKSKEKSHSSHSHRSSREHEKSTEKKDREDKHEKEKINKEESSSKHSDKHRSNNSLDKCKTSTNSEKNKSVSSSDKNKSSGNTEKHKSSSSEHKHKFSSSDHKHTSSTSSEKHKSNSLEHHGTSSDKNLHNSEKQSSHKSDKERHKRSYENEVSSDKYKSVEKSSKDEQIKEKSKEKHHSSKDKDSHKIEKKPSSKDTEASNSKQKSDSSHSSRESTKKSKHKSSSSKHKSKSTEEKDKPPKKGEDSDDGIDCGSGASFAEALGMFVSPTKPKKKSGLSKENIQSPNSPNYDLSPANLLAPNTKLAPLPSLEILALPEISANYRPRPPPKFLPHFNDEDAMSSAVSSKNQRTKVYSGNKVIGKITSLYDMCVQVLQEHIEALEYTGGVPYEILKPVVDRATPQQLFVLEHYNPYLMDDTDHLWQKFCERSFRNKKRQEMETWREMYIRCQEEQEIKLRSLTANIKMTQEAKKAPIKQTKMAYVDSVVKPPRNIAKKQAQHGTAFAATASPAARVASLSATSNVLKGGRAAPAPVLTSNFKPKKAPLMQKALQFMRGRKR